MLKKRRFFLSFVALIISITSCSANMYGTLQSVKINSNPTGAQVTIDGITYTTPATVNLRRGVARTLHFTKEGYQPVSINLSPKQINVILNKKQMQEFGLNIQVDTNE